MEILSVVGISMVVKESDFGPFYTAEFKIHDQEDPVSIRAWNLSYKSYHYVLP